MSNNPLTPAPRQKTAIEVLRDKLSAPSVQAKIKEALNERAPQFATALIQLISGNQYLQRCDPNTIIGAAMTAAVLDLPIDKNLGFAHIVPYGSTATFQLGYKAFIQLAIRSGQYKRLNATNVHAGELVSFNRLTGEAQFDFSKSRDEDAEVVGYAAFFELVTGYQQTVYWSKEDIINHAKKFSQAYKNGKKDSPWFTNFDAMARKTVLKDLLSHWGILSIQLQKALVNDGGIRHGTDTDVAPEFPEESKPGKPVHTLEVESEPVPEKPAVESDAPPMTGETPLKKADPVKTEAPAPVQTQAPASEPPAQPELAGNEPDAESAALIVEIGKLAFADKIPEDKIITYSKKSKLCGKSAESLNDFVPQKLKLLVENWPHIVELIRAS